MCTTSCGYAADTAAVRGSIQQCVVCTSIFSHSHLGIVSPDCQEQFAHGLVVTSYLFVSAQLNALRLAGLLSGALNGMFAVLVLVRYRDDPAGANACSFDPETHTASVQLQLVSDYTTFISLVIVNLFPVGYGESNAASQSPLNELSYTTL